MVSAIRALVSTSHSLVDIPDVCARVLSVGLEPTTAHELLTAVGLERAADGDDDA
jgi:hypothetical protein